MKRFRVLRMDDIIIPKENYVFVFNQVQILRGRTSTTLKDSFFKLDHANRNIPVIENRYSHTDPDSYISGVIARLPVSIALYELLNGCPWVFEFDNNGDLKLIGLRDPHKDLYTNLWLIYELAPYFKKKNYDASVYPQTSEIELIDCKTYDRYMIMVLEPNEKDKNSERNDRTKMVRVIKANYVS